jgi:hypothetical protein
MVERRARSLVKQLPFGFRVVMLSEIRRVGKPPAGVAAFGFQLFDLFWKNAPLTSGSFERRSNVWVRYRRRANLALRGMGEAFLDP